jgi:glutamate N-acetyltransferase/amino-acid N-acetyltransferase
MSHSNFIDVIETQSHELRVIANGGVTSAKGFMAGGLFCGLKRKRLDMAWLLSEVPAQAAGVYTTNLFQAAPLKVTQESLAVEQKLQGVLINSGNANACTGEVGLRNAYAMRKDFAEHVRIKEHYAAVVSTGVIGEQLPMDKITIGISTIDATLAHSSVESFEQAILTTDTCVKNAGLSFEIDGQMVTIGGAAKGSGMIHPNMATMLSFVTTDANVEAKYLQQALHQVTQRTFNQITVDGDTSTNDMVLVMANGLAGNEALSPAHPKWELFVVALEKVCQSLAKQIARDGEGATKLIEVQVSGAPTDEMAQKIGKSIIGSSLVKTAIFGTDANWGRIVCAIGYAGEPIIPEKVEVALGPFTVVKNGLPIPFSEEQAKAYLEQELIHITVELNMGEGKATCWGCDLTYDYVRINASYRT